MSLVNDLQAAKAVISDPKNWIKGSMAATSKRGDRISVHSSDAKCFCSLGAIERVTLDGTTLSGTRKNLAVHYLARAIRTKRKVEAVHPPYEVTGFNDNRRTNHAKVMAAFDSAIEMAEQDASRPA